MPELYRPFLCGRPGARFADLWHLEPGEVSLIDNPSRSLDRQPIYLFVGNPPNRRGFEVSKSMPGSVYLSFFSVCMNKPTHRLAQHVQTPIMVCDMQHGSSVRCRIISSILSAALQVHPPAFPEFFLLT